MTTPKKLIGLLACILILLIATVPSCKKDSANKTVAITAQATIHDTGPVEVDGCGWTVQINSTDSTYSPKMLAAQYMVDGLKVNVTFQKLTTKFQCGMVNNSGLTQIRISNISKAN